MGIEENYENITDKKCKRLLGIKIDNKLTFNMQLI